MTEKDTPYEHRGEGTGSTPERSAYSKHRDTAHGDAERRNELRPDERAEQDGFGRRTHPSTRATRKGED